MVHITIHSINQQMINIFCNLLGLSYWALVCEIIYNGGVTSTP